MVHPSVAYERRFTTLERQLTWVVEPTLRDKLLEDYRLLKKEYDDYIKSKS